MSGLFVVQYWFQPQWLREGVFTGISGDTAVVHTYDLAYMPLYFFLNDGRHNTWGQGRNDRDEWPRLTEESLDKINNTVIW